MQQTALNLIAIGVFAITLSTLLGPIFNISPLIPAITTLGIMGLATIDTLSWENKGVTLLLDSLSSGQHRKRVVLHEAGHFLAAYFLGIPITGYTLTAWEALKQGQPGLGGVIFDTKALSEKAFDGTEMPLILDRFCTVWMAGIAAETLVYSNANGGGEDRQKIKDALMSAGLSERVYQQKERWALLQAKNLIEKYQESYEALVKAMEERASVEECCRVIQQHC
ncbi:MAG: ATP-dependent Zn protease [Xenococcaceae cyanobacterium]